MYASAWIFVSAPDGRVVLDERAAPDDHVVADVATFPDARLVADDDPRAEVRAGEDDRARGDDRPRPELDRRQLLPLRRRARPKRRLLADHRVVEDLAAFTEHGPGIDDRCLGDVDAHPVSGGDCFERRLELVESADDGDCVARGLVRVALPGYQAQEVLAFTSQRLR